MRKSGSRLQVLLPLFSAGEPVTADFVSARTGWPGHVASKSLSNAKAHGYVTCDRVAPKHNGQLVHTLTEAGLVAMQGSIAGTDVGLASRATALILASDAGLDSEQLAEMLVASNAQVMAALEPAVDEHRVVACRLVRGGVEMRSYRKSAGAPIVSAWGKLMAATAPASEIAAARVRTTSARGLDIDAAHRVPSTGKIDKLTPPAEPARLDSVTQSSAEQLGDLIVAASEEAALDDDGREQWFCLYSSGELCIQRTDGSQVSLHADETRALFAWLDRLGGTNLQRLAAAQEATE